jgi:hypothetical protein
VTFRIQGVHTAGPGQRPRELLASSGCSVLKFPFGRWAIYPSSGLSLQLSLGFTYRRQELIRLREILDIYHARQHLWNLAAMLFPYDEVGKKRWVKRFQQKLDSGKIKKLVADLRSTPGANDELSQAIEAEAAYYEKNAERMRYPDFRRQNLFVGQEWSRLAAKRSSAPASRYPACFGLCAGPTPFLPSAATS